MYTKYTYKIIEFLLRHRTEEYNINQLSRSLKISPGGVHKILKSLVLKGVAIRKERGNATYYSVNLNDKEAKKLSELVLLESRGSILTSNPQAKVYATDLEKGSQFAKAIILFGSILDKKTQAKDIDVLFLTDKKKVKKVEDFCMELSTIRPKKVIPVIMTVDDFVRNLRKKDEVILEILRTGVVIHGEETIIEALGRLSDGS